MVLLGPHVLVFAEIVDELIDRSKLLYGGIKLNTGRTITENLKFLEAVGHRTPVGLMEFCLFNLLTERRSRARHTLNTDALVRHLDVREPLAIGLIEVDPFANGSTRWSCVGRGPELLKMCSDLVLYLIDQNIR